MAKPVQVNLEKALEEILSNLWFTQSRLNEVKEFEKQWKTVFENVAKATGIQDPSIRILNNDTYRTFVLDKIRVTTLELTSLINNEIIDQKSAVQLAKKHLRVPTYNDLLATESNSKTRFMYGPNMSKPTAEEEAKRQQEIREDNARRYHESMSSAFLSLYGETGTHPTAEGHERLVTRLKGLIERLTAIRHIIAHPYERPIVDKNRVKAESLTVEVITTIFNEFFQIIRDLYLIVKNASIGDIQGANETSISDQIDIILFGSINMACNTFDLTQNGPWYYLARERFYESDRVKIIIADPPSEPVS